LGILNGITSKADGRRKNMSKNSIRRDQRLRSQCFISIVPRIRKLRIDYNGDTKRFFNPLAYHPWQSGLKMYIGDE
jgi:hypothetical protein